jgi:exodeoxyribonuclease VII small subunit
MTSGPESFEAAFSQLEACVEALERGGLTLEEGIARFEAGMQLANHCTALLEQAELRVTQLLAEDEVEPAF